MTPVLISIEAFRTVTAERKFVYVGNAASPAVLGLGGKNWQPNISTRPVLSLELMSPDLNGRIQAGTCRFALDLNGLKDQDGNSVYSATVKWRGAAVEVFLPTELSISSTPTFQGRISDTRLDLDRGILSVTATVPIEFLEGNLLTEEFNGDNAAGGEPEVRGTLKPAGFGPCENIPPVWFDTTRWIGMIDGYANTVSVNKLMEGLADRGTAVQNYANYAALAAGIDNDEVAPGRWATCVAEGLIGLGAPPEYPVTVNATFGSDRIGAIIQRVLTTHLGVSAGDIDAAAFTALDAAVDRQVRYWTSSQRGGQDLIESLAASANATPLIRFDGLVSITRAVSSAPVLTLNRNGSTLPRVTDWQVGNGNALPWRIAARVARPASTLAFNEVLYEDDIIDRGLYNAAEVYRQGHMVWSGDKSSWLYTNATPDSGNAPPTWPTASNAHWQNLSPPVDAASIGVEPGATVGAQTGVNLTDSGSQILSDADIGNVNITIGPDGTLSGGGGGQVTLSGLGFTGVGEGLGFSYDILGANTWTIGDDGTFMRNSGGFGGEGLIISREHARSGVIYFEYDFSDVVTQRTRFGFIDADARTYDGSNHVNNGDWVMAIYVNNNSDQINFNWGAEGEFIDASSRINPGAASGWVAFVFDGFTGRLYHNGALIGEDQIPPGRENKNLRFAMMQEYAYSDGSESPGKVAGPLKCNLNAANNNWAQQGGEGIPSNYATAGTRLRTAGGNYASGSSMRNGHQDEQSLTDYTISHPIRGSYRASYKLENLLYNRYLKLVPPGDLANAANLISIPNTGNPVIVLGGVTQADIPIAVGDTIEIIYDGQLVWVAASNQAGTIESAKVDIGSDLTFVARWNSRSSAAVSPAWNFIEMDWGSFTDNSWETTHAIPSNLDSLVGTEPIQNTSISIGSDGTLAGGGGGQVTLPGLGAGDLASTNQDELDWLRGQTWNSQDLGVDLVISGSTLSKPSGTDSYANRASGTILRGSGFMQFRASVASSPTVGRSFAGLTALTTPLAQGYFGIYGFDAVTTISLASVYDNVGTLLQNGASRPHLATDLFSIFWDGAEIRMYHNEVLALTRAAPFPAMVAAATIFDEGNGNTVTDMRCGPYNPLIEGAVLGLNQLGEIVRPLPLAIANASQLLRFGGGGLFAGELDATFGAIWTGAGANVFNRPINLAALIGNEALENSLISLAADGTLGGAGGGQVTLPGLGGEAGADVTKSVEGASTINFDYDSDGVIKAAQTGNRGVFTLTTSGGVNITSGVAWAVTVISGSYQAAEPTMAGTGSAQVNFGSQAITGGKIRITATYLGRTYTKSVDITVSQDPPPTGGGGGGGGGSTNVTGNATGPFGTPWGTIYQDTVSTDTGVTQVVLTANNHLVYPILPAVSFALGNIQYQWQRETSVGSGSWTDVGAVADSLPDPFFDDEGGFPIGEFGVISCTRTDTGRTASTEYSYRLRARISSGSLTQADTLDGTIQMNGE